MDAPLSPPPVPPPTCRLPVILGSSSQGRQKVLREWGVPYRVMKPDIDEKAVHVHQIHDQQHPHHDGQQRDTSDPTEVQPPLSLRNDTILISLRHYHYYHWVPPMTAHAGDCTGESERTPATDRGIPRREDERMREGGREEGREDGNSHLTLPYVMLPYPTLRSCSPVWLRYLT